MTTTARAARRSAAPAGTADCPAAGADGATGCRRRLPRCCCCCLCTVGKACCCCSMVPSWSSEHPWCGSVNRGRWFFWRLTLYNLKPFRDSLQKTVHTGWRARCRPLRALPSLFLARSSPALCFVLLLTTVRYHTIPVLRVLVHCFQRVECLEEPL